MFGDTERETQNGQGKTGEVELVPSSNEVGTGAGLRNRERKVRTNLKIDGERVNSAKCQTKLGVASAGQEPSLSNEQI